MYIGFIYKWYDKKRKMYYIGSHNGSIDDSYICSNQRMHNAYRKRPTDFNREILEYNTSTDLKLTLVLEQKHLDAVNNIKDHPDYYNKKNEAEGGWSFITNAHISKRATTLRKKHNENGLSTAEIKSYETKINTRLQRISNTGFTKKEIEQHASYGYKCKVILPDGSEKIYPSLAKASRELGIDCQSARHAATINKTFKGYKVFVIATPKTDCRSFK